MDEEVKICMRDINPHIVCSLCAGYFIEATTVTECLHTFCKSCIVKYLQSSKHCPQCNIKIHETQPLMNLRADRTMQDIVYKIVPGLYDNEESRRQQFSRSRGLIKEEAQESKKGIVSLQSLYDNPTAYYYSNDEQITLCLERFCLEYDGFRLECLPKKFLRCSIRVCIYHLQQLLRKKLQIPAVYDVEVLCSNNILPKDMTMKHVYLANWKGKGTPLLLFYRVTQDGLS